MSLHSRRNISELINKFDRKTCNGDNNGFESKSNNRRNYYYRMDNSGQRVGKVQFTDRNGYTNNNGYADDNEDGGIETMGPTTTDDGDSEINEQLVISRYSYVKSDQRSKVTFFLSRIGAILEMFARLSLPKMSMTGMGICSLIAIFMCPRTFGELFLFPAFRLLFGTLYPAYASYKAVRTKNVKEYVKWMMYWIVFAFFTCIETFTDIFLAWFPFYYEMKVLVVLWLLSPATKGSSTLYRKFVHPMLTRREQEIDDYISQAKEKGYTAVLQLGSKGVNYATNVIMQTAIKVISPIPLNGLLNSQSDSAIASSSSSRRGRDVPDFVVQESHRSKSMQSVLYGEQSQQLYEIDSEEEDQFLRFDRGSSRPPSRASESEENLEAFQSQHNVMDVIEEDELMLSDPEEGAAKTRAAPQPKTRRAKAAAAAKISTAKAPAGPRGRRKLRKDSDVDVDSC